MAPRVTPPRPAERPTAVADGSHQVAQESGAPAKALGLLRQVPAGRRRDRHRSQAEAGVQAPHLAKPPCPALQVLRAGSVGSGPGVPGHPNLSLLNCGGAGSGGPARGPPPPPAGPTCLPALSQGSLPSDPAPQHQTHKDSGHPVAQAPLGRDLRCACPWSATPAAPQPRPSSCCLPFPVLLLLCAGAENGSTQHIALEVPADPRPGANGGGSNRP